MLFSQQLSQAWESLEAGNSQKAWNLIDDLHTWANRSPRHHLILHCYFAWIAGKAGDHRGVLRQCWLGICAPFASLSMRFRSKI